MSKSNLTESETNLGVAEKQLRRIGAAAMGKDTPAAAAARREERRRQIERRQAKLPVTTERRFATRRRDDA